MPAEQNMAVSLLRSLMPSVLGGKPAAAARDELFAKTDPAADGDECLRDCESCSVRYPRGFKIDEEDVLYGRLEGWSTHVLVATGKTDWVRDVADEKGSVMEAIGKADGPTNGANPKNKRLMVSASNMATPHDTHDYSQPTTVLLLPAFIVVQNVDPRNVATLIREIVDKSPTSESPLTRIRIQRRQPSFPASASASLSLSLPSADPDIPVLETKACPHSAVVLMCSQGTRDARCGQSAPLLRKELERHLRPLGLYRDMHDERPGGVAIYFISHVGGHKYSANVIVYRRPNAFGLDDDDDDDDDDVSGTAGTAAAAADDNGNASSATPNGRADLPDSGVGVGVGAAQCIWLARVRPQDCENLVRYTVLKGKVVKPESQLRGGFDRVKGLTSW